MLGEVPTGLSLLGVAYRRIGEALSGSSKAMVAMACLAMALSQHVTNRRVPALRCSCGAVLPLLKTHAAGQVNRLEQTSPKAVYDCNVATRFNATIELRNMTVPISPRQPGLA